MSGFSAKIPIAERLKSAVPAHIYEKGKVLFAQGNVGIEKLGEQLAQFAVNDYRLYHTEIRLVNNTMLFKCNCTYASRAAICEHEVASGLALEDHFRQRLPPPWKTQLSQATSAGASARRTAPTPYLLFFSLQPEAGYGNTFWKIQPHHLPLTALNKELRTQVTELQGEELYRLIENNSDLGRSVRTPYQGLNPAGCLNCPLETVAFANILQDRLRNYSPYSTTSLAEQLLLLASYQSPLFLAEGGQPLRQWLRFHPGEGEVRLDLTRSQEGLHLSARLSLGEQSIHLAQGRILFLTFKPVWVLADAWLVKLPDEAQANLLSAWLNEPEITIPLKDQAEFQEKYLLSVAEQLPLDGDVVTYQLVGGDPLRRVYLSDSEGQLQARLRFAYGEVEVGYHSSFPAVTLAPQPGTWNLLRVQRQPQVERLAGEALAGSAYGLKRLTYPAQGVFQLRARVHPVDFLLHDVPRLVRDGFEVFGEEQLKTARVNRNTPRLSLNVSTGIDWFDVRVVVNFGELEVALKDIRKAVRRQERYVKLADGTIGQIPEEWIERYKHLFALGEERGESVRLSKYHLALVDELLTGADQQGIDAEFQRRRERLQGFSGIQRRAPPSSFQGELRPYQQAGLEWLHFLNEFEYGGCLADDMGLGKTIQVLAFFQSLLDDSPEGEKPTSLVVVPRSLLVNWQREAARFTPQLRLLEHFDQNRTQDPAVFAQYDLVITTYGVMLRDIELFKRFTFHHVLLDESQVIKNPLALTTRAARLLRARRRLVLTGTPVENTTLELWSQFSFLNPGLLGSLDYFRQEFGVPIEKKSDEKAAELLRKMVYPFLLRRTKDQVAPELPPRSERILYCDMEPAQRKLYNRTRDYYRGMLLGMIEAEGMNNARMRILEGLLRLRQICNHPSLMDSHFKGDSGKFILLLETMETLRLEGHKALVYSQFVQMLRLVRQALDERLVPYTYLDGHTRARQEVVDLFQNEAQIPLFLISLKAGGVGLNLTAADYVLHIDPWWNPAVERQASDRTHRIGQEKPVFVYKMITRDSVEEKILLLQERKKSLVDQLIIAEKSFIKALTEEDVRVLFS
jgi:non-specific serine/threonine protein kinase